MDEKYESKRAETFRWFILIYSALFLCRAILPANIDNIATALTVSRNLIAVVAGIDLLVLTIAILAWGYWGEKLAEKYSIKKIFALTQFGWVACFALVAISTNFVQFSFFLVLRTCFEGAFMPLAFSMIGDFFPPKERGEKFGWINFGLIFGSGGGLIFGTFLGGIEGIGWRLAYGLGVILSFLAVLIYTWVGIEPTRGLHEPELADLSKEVDYNYRLTLSSIKEVFKTKTVAVLLISVLITGIATATLGLWALDYFQHSQLLAFGASAGLFALLFITLTGLGALPGNVQGGKLGDKYYKEGRIRWRVLISLIGILVGLACMFGFYLIPVVGVGLELALISILVIGLGFAAYWLLSFPVGNNFAIYSEVCVPESRSTVNALHGVFVNIGGVIGNFLLATLIVSDEVLPWHVAILLIFWLGGGLLWIIIYFTYPKEAQQCRDLMAARRKELELS
jgi:MFS family permease